MKPKLCPFTQFDGHCQTADCALCINDQCAFVVIARNLNAMPDLSAVEYSLVDSSNELSSIAHAIKGLV